MTYHPSLGVLGLRVERFASFPPGWTCSVRPKSPCVLDFALFFLEIGPW